VSASGGAGQQPSGATVTVARRADGRRRRHFITGAGSGIGAAVAATLYDRGDQLWLLARSDKRADDLAQNFPDARVIVGDLANPTQLELILASAPLPGFLDSLLLIAGVIGFSRVVELSAGQLGEQVNVNLVAPMVLTRALLPAVRAGRGLVLIANSTAILSAGGGRSAYVASKSGIRGFADVLRAEESSHGVPSPRSFPVVPTRPCRKRSMSTKTRSTTPHNSCGQTPWLNRFCTYSTYQRI